MKICPNCGTETTDTARFCRKCGTNIEAEPILEAPAEETPEAEAPAEEIPDAEAPAEEAPIAEEAAEEPVVEAAAEEPEAIEAEEAPDEEDVPEEGPVEEETEPAKEEVPEEEAPEEEAPEEEAPEEEAPEEEAPEEEDVPEEEPAEEDETATDEIADGEPEDEQTKEGEPSLIAALERMVDKEPAEEPEEEPEEEPAEEPIEEPIAYREPTEAEDGSIEFDWNQPVEVERPEGGWQKGLGEGGEANDPAADTAGDIAGKTPDNASGSVLFGGAAAGLAANEGAAGAAAGAGANAARSGEAEAGFAEADGEAAEYDGDGSSYEWGPPLGAIDGDDPASMVPIHIGSRPSEDEADEDYDGDYDEEYEQYRYETYGEWDHTDDFDPEDISENKVMAMAAYLLGPLGIIIALLAAQSSPFAAFHVRQSMKFVVTEALTLIVMSLLCWTLIVPAAGIIFLAVLAVVKIIAFVSVCKGRAVEPPIIRGLKFLK